MGLAWRLSNAGEHDGALAANQQAVTIYRALAAANSRDFDAALATALSLLGVELWNLGRRKQALQASEEAVAILRHLAAANREAFAPLLAAAVNNLSADFSEVGQW